MKLIDPDSFKGVFRGKQVSLTTLKNKNGMVAQITNYGGRVVSLWTKDKHGDLADIVLGYESLDGYLNSNEIYFGALIGRYGNRIANGQFSIGDSVYTLTNNNGSNHLHGGPNGFHNVVWDVDSKTDSTLVLNYL
ncbi:MAG: galactose-1-epimerase, partial [Bacteroidota bacterium]